MQNAQKSMTMVEQASEALLLYMDEHNLKAGDSLPSIAQMSEQFGASRAVIRESLRSLEARGIVQLANGRKARIKPVTSEPLVDFFQRFSQVENRAVWEFAEIRIALEMQCVRIAAERAKDSELSALRATVQEMRASLNNARVFAELDTRFHLQIAHATHNGMMVYLLESLRDAISVCIREGLHQRPTPAQMEVVQGYHERLVETLLQRDAEGAAQAMKAHFDETSMLLA